MHLDIHGALGQQFLDVRPQILIANPGGERAVSAAKRHAVQAKY